MKRGLTAAPQNKNLIHAIKGSQKLPSLARVAVVFFGAILLVGFPDDDCHSVLPYVEGYTHTPSPPFGECRSSRQALLLFILPRAGLFHSIFFTVVCQSHANPRKVGIAPVFTDAL